jgi:predicted cupin superfamily sugar epimerase
MMTAEEIIALLGLQPHPREGGFFRETYRSVRQLAAGALGGVYTSPRSVSTAIFYLLTPGTCSAIHRLASDEIFHFYLGDPVRMVQLFPDGRGTTVVLGRDLQAGQNPQVIVPAGVWQGSILEDGGRFALLGCTVAPGFDFADYEHGDRDALLARYPEFDEMIRRLT